MVELKMSKGIISANRRRRKKQLFPPRKGIELPSKLNKQMHQTKYQQKHPANIPRNPCSFIRHLENVYIYFSTLTKQHVYTVTVLECNDLFKTGGENCFHCVNMAVSC